MVCSSDQSTRKIKEPLTPRYNGRVPLRIAITVLALSTTILAQSPSPCPADRPVDEIIAEMNKQSSHKGSRNKGLLPHTFCLGGWCRDTGRTPPTTPTRPPEQTQQAPQAPAAADESSSRADGHMPVASSETSNNIATEKCNEALDRALEAAHNVEVGDYWFGDKKNFKAALSRYEQALDEKPDDPAIHVRAGRALEKLNDVPQAITEYKAAEKLGKPGKWTDEAHAALLRLEASSH